MRSSSTSRADWSKQYDLLIAQSPAVMFIIEIDKQKKTHISFISGNMKQVLGYEPDYFYPGVERVIEKTHHLDKTKVEDFFLHLGEDGETSELEYRFQDAAGNIRWLHDKRRFTINDDGIIRVIGSFYDITEQKRNEERMNLAIEGTNSALWDWNIRTGEVVINDRWAQMIGYTLNELLPATIETWFRFAHPEDLTKSNALIEKHIRGEIDFYDIELRMRHKDGHWIWVHDRGKLVEHTLDGKPLRMTGTHSDITKRKEAERKRQIEEDKLRSIIQTSLDGFFSVDTQGKIIDANESYCLMTGYSVEELTTMSLEDVEALEKPEETASHIQKIIKTGFDRFKTKHRTKAGTIIDLEVSVTFLSTPETSFFVSFVRDITEQLKAEQELKEYSIRDPLTNVYNRRHLMERLNEMVHKFHRTGDSFSLAMMDIDFFKKVNDKFGHVAGDFLLKEFADLIQNRIREYDILGRYGGEEFLVLFCGIGSRQAHSTVERILNEVRNREFIYEKKSIHFTFSCGITQSGELIGQSDKNIPGINSIIEIADRRLYKAKQTGRNRILSAD